MKYARIAAVMLLLAGVAGCSTFERDYRQAVANGQVGDSVEGAWDGRWQSEAGHGGDQLRALVSRTAADTYHTRFRAQYWGIFAAEEDVDLHVMAGTPLHATGEADLGWLKGGVYKYDATLTPAKLDATYESKYDHGTFRLERPK